MNINMPSCVHGEEKKGKLTELVNIVSANFNLVHHSHTPNTRLLSARTKAFAQNNKLMPWKVIFFDSLANDVFRNTTRVNVCSIPLYMR